MKHIYTTLKALMGVTRKCLFSSLVTHRAGKGQRGVPRSAAGRGTSLALAGQPCIAAQ